MTITLGGKDLMRDTAGMWAYIPERDEGLQALARNLGVGGVREEGWRP